MYETQCSRTFYIRIYSTFKKFFWIWKALKKQEYDSQIYLKILQ